MTFNGRGVCSVCGKNVAVRDDGGAYAHYAIGGLYDGAYCKGRGEPTRRSSAPTTAEEHAQAILSAVQSAELAGFTVEIVLGGPGDDCLTVADHFRLVQPVEEDEPWDMEVYEA